jgi:hypothetical protein
VHLACWLFVGFQRSVVNKIRFGEDELLRATCIFKYHKTLIHSLKGNCEFVADCIGISLNTEYPQIVVFNVKLNNNYEMKMERCNLFTQYLQRLFQRNGFTSAAQLTRRLGPLLRCVRCPLSVPGGCRDRHRVLPAKLLFSPF